MKRWRSSDVRTNWPDAGPQRRTLAEWWKAFKAWLARALGGRSEDGVRRGGLGRTGQYRRIAS